LASYNESYKDLNEIGYIDDNGKAQINQEKQAKWIVNRVKMSKCNNCYVFPICCGGSCPYMKNIQKRDSCLPVQEMIKAHLRCLDSKGHIQTVL
jgi:radical SAM protein with 4Fe4S-binding SPASM domain